MNNYLYRLKIADIVFIIDSDYEITFRHNTKPFLTDDNSKPDFHIVIRKADKIVNPTDGILQGDRYYIDNEIHNELYILSKGKMIGFHSEYVYKTKQWKIRYTEHYLNNIRYIDVLLGYIGIENTLRYRHGLFLHSSLIRWNEYTILFSAPSGTGKSTQADLWVKYQEASIINGDRSCVRKIKDTWYAYGSPYAGSSGIYVNDGAPIKALFLLRQAPVNELIEITETEAVKFLFPEIVMHHWDPYFVNDILNYLSELIHDIPVYVLACTPDINAVNEAMKAVGK